MKRVAVRTKRLVLRALRRGDFEAWRESELSRGPKRTPYDRGPREPEQVTRAKFDEKLERIERLARTDDSYVYAVFLRSTGELIGGVDIQVIHRGVYQMANFGYQIHNGYWGRGFGREAAAAGLRIGFTELRLNRLEAAIDLDNPRSLRLARAIGMRREGVKKRYIFEDGKWTDNVVFAANPEDVGLEAKAPRKPKRATR